MATRIEDGKLYKVTAIKGMEYLTIGQVYRADVGKGSIGLHRESDHAGTFIPTWKVSEGFVTLEPAS